MSGLRLLVLLAAGFAAFAVHAGEVQVAVASNFTAAMQKIAPLFEQDTGHKAVLAFGSTGRFYSQIANGAPFEVLLAADDETTLRLEEDGHAVRGSSFTYAKGKLVLWSKERNFVDPAGAVLRNPTLTRVAIADPRLAPYGLAAVEAITNLRLAQALEPKLVRGENITQAYQFASSGNAQVGFIALSQVMRNGKIEEGSAWLVPSTMYTPIVQTGAVLTRGKDNPAAAALVEYLRGEKARALMREFGYGF